MSRESLLFWGAFKNRRIPEERDQVRRRLESKDQLCQQSMIITADAKLLFRYPHCHECCRLPGLFRTAAAPALHLRFLSIYPTAL